MKHYKVVFIFCIKFIDMLAVILKKITYSVEL